MTNQEEQNEHKLSSLTSDDSLFKLDTLSNQSLPSIIKNDTEISSLNDIEKQFTQISPSFYSKSLSSIPYIDSSSLLEDQDIFERNQFSSDLNRQISLTETDLVSSLHRNLNKQNIDNSSSSDDDILFLEWDKERNLFQDYINSLRKEIRVLLQERLEYQQKIPNESKHINDDQMKIDLLQKSLEEKNFVLKQLQNEYEIIKEKNTNLIRKISLAQCDTKSYIDINDELKQKIADLTIDLQNHVLVKRRLEISINNLEKDCKIIDAERIRLTNDIKENQHNKQDLEKLLQKANVQIAEQGSTIEMLRSENVQVRSQLSTIQRRMFQEKQQIMDYLRQIENDLIEKEQIKQRESLLREDYEQLKNSINHDQQKLEALQQEYSQLLKTIQIQNEEKDQFKSGIKHLYSHFHIPIESHEQFYLSFKPIENHFNDLQNQINQLQKSDNEDELRENFVRLTNQCTQLDEANRAWQQFHQTQLDNFRNKLQNILPIETNFSFDEIAQLIVNYLNKNLHTESIDREPELSSFNPSKQTPSEEVSIHNLTSVQSTPSLINEHDEELRQLRENVTTLTSQCAQLDEANRAWQQYQQIQLDNFRNKLQYYLPLDENISFDQVAQLIVNQIIKEREEFNQKYQELEKTNNDLLSKSAKTIDELTQELLALKEDDIETSESLSSDSTEIEKSNIDEINRIYEQFRNNLPISNEASIEEIISYINNLIKEKGKAILNDDDQLKQDYILLQNQCIQLDQANRAWQQFYENQIDLIRNQFKDYLDFDKNLDFNQIIQIIVSEFHELGTTINSTDLPKKSSFDSEQILNLQEEIKFLENQIKDHHSSMDLLENNLQLTTYENEQLKQNYHEIQEKYNLFINNNQNLTNQLNNIRRPSIEESATYQLQTSISPSTTQCTQLDEDNRAWQQFHQNQLEIFREKLQNWISLDTNSTLEQIAQQILNQLDFLKNQYNESILNHNLEELNQKLIDVYKQCEEFREHNAQLILLKQHVEKQLEERENQIKEFQNSQQHIDSSKFKDLDQFRNTFQDYVHLDENISFDQVPQLIMDQIIKEREEFNQRYQTLERENNDLRIESENNIESSVITIQELNQELFDIKTQCQEYEKINKQLLIENKSLDDRSIVVGHQFQSTIDKYTQYKPLEQNHIAIETNPLIYQNNHTQIDSIHMIDQQSQTELLWPISDNENILNNDKQLNEYINEILFLSLTELADQLKKECEQILSKLNFNLESFPNLELNQLVLITLYFLSNQHLIDEAKQLYTETVIRALKQEYELINNEKNDLIQQFDLERSQSEELIKDLNKKLIDKQNSSSKTEPIQINEQQQQQVNNNALQTIKNKIDQIVGERPELFPDSNDDTIERLDHLISAIEHQAAQIDLLKNELTISVSKLTEERNQIQDDEEIRNLKSQLAERDEQIEELNKKYSEISSNIEILIQERDNLRDQCNELTRLSSRINQIIDNETQTDDQQQDKFIQINNKLKRALQTIKEKINRIVNEKPELFPQSTDDTIERLDQLISAVENQTKHIEISQNGHDYAEHEIDEHQAKIEQVISQVPSFEDYQKQIDQLQQNLSQKEEERTLLRDHFSEVELELRKIIDDQTSTTDRLEALVEERNVLVEQQSLQLIELQQQIEQLREEIAQLQQTDIPSDETIQSLKKTIQQQSKELRDLSEKCLSQIESQDGLSRQKRETEEQLNEHKNQIDNLMQERIHLLEEIERKTLPLIQTTDNESQTDNRQYEKLVQVNNKLKRVLQTFKDKIQRVATERPELFEGIGEETSERLDHLISTVENQATQINVLQAERDQVEEQLQNEIKQLQSSLETSQNELDNEREMKMEQFSTPPTEDSSSSIVEDYQKQIEQLQQNLSEKDNERTSLSERLDEIELELKKAIDDHASIAAKYETLIEERDALVEQKILHSTESQREIEQLKEELAKLTQSTDYQHVEIQTDEDIEALHGTIEQQTEQLKDLNEKNSTLSSQLESQTELNKQLNEHKNQIESLKQERAKLLEELEKKTLPPIQTTDNESQTDDHQHEKLVQMNNKLKRALQTFKDKIHRVVNERPDLFDGIGEETSERLDHLISTVENQATKVNKLQAELDQTDEKYQGQIKNLQSSLDACQYELDNERQIKMERLISTASLSSAPPEDISSSIVEDYQKQIKQLQQNLSQKDDERILLRERLNEVELELRKTLDNDASVMAKYESIVEERDRLVKQQTLHSTENQREIEQLKEELANIKELPVTYDAHIQTDEDIKSLHDVIEQQSERMKDLNEKNATLSSQLESQAELNKQKKQIEERLKDYENQIKTLTQQRTNLLEDIEKKTLSPIESADNESQTDDRQHEKLIQVNNKLKRVLQTFKDKIQRVVTERPELFEGISEETNERLDHLISTVENQATQNNVLQAERDQVEEQLRNEIKELQSSLETSKNEVENERREKVEQLSLLSENYQKQNEQLKQNISEKDNERTSLSERLNEVELELRKIRDEHALKSFKDEEDLQSLVKERNALTEQQALRSEEHQRQMKQLEKDNDQIREELAVIKKPIDCQHVEIQTDENINALHEVMKEQTEQLKILKDKCLHLASQIDSHAELQAEEDRKKNDTEEQIRDYKNQLDNLMQERGNLLEKIQQKNTLIPTQTIDHEAQTDDREHEKLAKMNNELNCALQTFKDKIQRVVTERPELFDDVAEETDERLDHLISTVENQATQVNVLKAQRDQIEEQLQNGAKELQRSLETSQNELDNERREKVEQLSSQSENHQKHIQELQQNISEKDTERTSLGERLNEVELELKKAIDDHASFQGKYESLIEERDALVGQQILHSTETQHEIEQLKEEVTKLKQSPDYQHVEIQTDEDIEALHETIKQQSEQLKDLNEKNTTLSSQLESHGELNREKKEIEEQLDEHKIQIESIKEERAKLLEELEKKTLPTMQTTENETQTDDSEHEQLVQVNNKLEHALQTFKDKIDRIVIHRGDLFDGIGEEVDDRLDHLMSTVVSQATQVNVLKAERDQVEEQLQTEIKQLQSSLETSQNELDNERREKVEQLSSQSENHQKQIQELQQNISEKDNERSSLSERLNEVELDLKKAVDDHVSLQGKYETLTEERNALVEQQALFSAESQREIEQLKEEVTKLKQSPDYQHVEIQTDEDIEALHETIKQQSEQLKDLNEKNTTLSSQLESHGELNREKKEIEEQLNEHKIQIESLKQERAKLLEELEKKTLPTIQTIENESQTDDSEHEKLIQVKNELNCALKTFKDKIDRIVTEKPDLFEGIGEEAGERLNHLISTIGTQATQVDVLKAERDQVEEQLQTEIKQLQSSLETSQNELDNERREKVEQLSSQSENHQKQIQELQQNLSEKDNERSSLSERLNEVELELKKAVDDHASVKAKYESLIEEQNALVEQQALHSTESQREIEQLKKEIAELKQLPDYQHVEIQTDEDMKALNEMIEQLKDLNEKNTTLSSQLESQAELNRQKREIEEQLNERENQIDNLMQERAKLLEDTKSLKSAVEIIEDKLHQVITTRPDLFENIGEKTSEQLDHLISSMENQATQIIELQTEHDQSREKYQHEINDLQNSFDIYRKQTDEYISSLTPITHDIETQTIDLPTIDNRSLNRENTQTTESDDSEPATWFDASPDITDKEGIEQQQFRDIDIQCEFEKSSSLQLATQTEIDSFFFIENENLRTKINEILLDYPTLFSTSNKNPFEDLDQIISLIKNLQNEIKDLQSSFNTNRNKIENDRLIKMETFKSNHVYTQTLGLSIFEEHEKQITDYKQQIERLIEERNQTRDLLSKESNNGESTSERIIKQSTSEPLKIDVEIQTINDLDLSSSSDQSISRHMFEQEMLAWSKESEQLKRFVKQIQIENNKLKDIIFQFEQKIHDYLHENERLKHENQHLSLIKYSSVEKDHFTTSDDDICYLTLKCLTYEVAQRTSNNNEQLSLLTNHSEQDLKQQSNATERQMKTICVQNERLKSQLESYTIHFKHVQHEMSLKLQEMSILKGDIERLRMNEIQSRMENYRLKCDLDDDQIKIQQLERELADLKFKQSSKDTNSINNLLELLELKERELNALKEKLDYTKETHQIELQEAHKTNQFSLDNVKRFEQMDLCHEEKRRELEIRLGKFCTIARSLITNQEFFIENPIINIDELQKLIAETDTQERITNTLSPVRDCLSLLEAQIKDLHHSIIENHARRSKRWKYKLGFECLTCESRWEVVHDVRDLQEACLDPNRFLESSIVEPMAGCSCPIMIDFIESDIRLCLDDILNDVIVRTTVK